MGAYLSILLVDIFKSGSKEEVEVNDTTNCPQGHSRPITSKGESGVLCWKCRAMSMDSLPFSIYSKKNKEGLNIHTQKQKILQYTALLLKQKNA